MNARWTSLVAAFAVGLGMTASAPAAAADLAMLRAAYADLDYEACLDESEDALEYSASKAERVETWRFVGLCNAALGEDESARDAFVKMLAIDRSAKLPKGLSPRFTSAYLEARGRWVDQVPLGIAIEKEERDGQSRLLRLKLTDPEGMIAKIAWRDDDGETRGKMRSAERMEFNVPASVAVELVAFDANNGELLTFPLIAPQTAPPPPVETESEDEGGSNLLSYVGIAAGGAALLTLAAGAGIAAYFYKPTSVSLTPSVVFGDQ